MCGSNSKEIELPVDPHKYCTQCKFCELELVAEYPETKSLPILRVYRAAYCTCYHQECKRARQQSGDCKPEAISWEQK
jgi:hypothetical protein